jgi:hypothetical protein
MFDRVGVTGAETRCRRSNWLYSLRKLRPGYKEATMRLQRRTGVAAAALVVGLVAAAGAGGYTIGRSTDVPRGGSATFLPSNWLCKNYGTRVECFSGDAFPYAELTSTSGGGITVKVHTLRDPQGGHLTRTYVKNYPVYVFTAR